MKDYQKNTGWKTLQSSKEILGVTKAEKILLYMPVLNWYLNHGLKVTDIYKYLKYRSSGPFSWFPEEVSRTRRDEDSNPALKQLGDTYKLKGNSFYGKLIEDLIKHIKTIFTSKEDLVDQSFRSPFFEDLEQINGAFEIKEHEKKGQYHKTLSLWNSCLSVSQTLNVRVLL